MKKFIIVALSFICLQINGQFTNDVEYKYPFYAGDEKWKMFDTPEERIAALQIPDSLLCRMSTSQLLTTCLDYPYMKEVLFAENIETGIDYISSSFNGFAELIKRQDFITSLITKEQQFPIELENVRSKNSIQRGTFSFKSFMVDFLLLHHLSTISDKRKQEEAISAIENNYEVKKKNKDIFGAYLLSPYLITAIQGGTFLEEQIRFSGGSGTYVLDSIYTPRGTRVYDTYRFVGTDWSFSSDELDDLADAIYNTYNGAILIAPPSLRYNCHGYAWNVSEGGDQVWIGYSTQTAEDVYWTDGSYVQTTESDATKVSYTYGNHSAIRINSTWYQSKWGNSALVQHHPNDVPANYNASLGMTFYKKGTPLHISGPTVSNGASIYSVENIGNGCTVTWSLSGYIAAFLNVQQNTPSANQCTLTFKSGSHDDAGGQLIASIYNGSALVKTITKDICVINNFHVTYKQDACAYYGVSHPAIPPTTMNQDIFYFVHQGCPVTLTCSLFKYFNLSWGSGYQPSDYYYVNNNTFSFVFPLGSGGIPCYLNIKDETGQLYKQLKFFSVSGNGNLTSNNISIQQVGSQLKVSLINFAPNDDDIIERSQSERNDNIKWTLEIYNASTAERQYAKEISCSSCDVDISDLKKGLYIIRALIGDEILNEKITIQ